jgi:hypothetical protein
MSAAAAAVAYALAMAGQSAVERAQNAVRVSVPGATTQLSADAHVSTAE